ncbi:MAG: hypothetical protein BMS9Abin15_1046 [Gammaproteobacteria bacterium]|nr:MAG: hypothetical protein BMS9Abin15_1046 [Gammaproteobacteria bacterium]
MNQSYHHTLTSGTRVDTYEVAEVLGVGGFGITYKAFDHSLEREVALKEYFPSILARRDPDGVRIRPITDHEKADYDYGLDRFLDEAKTLAKFNEPNIVRVHRFIKGNGTAYIVMDFEDGEPLGDYLKKNITLGQKQIMDVMIPILKGLRTVHAKSVLHRDIKPTNIYLRHDDQPVLLDFGSARESLGNKTMTVLVTPGYAPYEQYSQQKTQGPWSDIYAVGATMFLCATGIKPAAAIQRHRLAVEEKQDPVRHALETLGPDYGKEFIDFITWLLEVMPEDRPQSADEALKVAEQLPPPPSGARNEPIHIDDDMEIEWNPEFLDAIEEEFTRKIGAHSPDLIKDAADKAHDVQELTQILAKNIGEEENKEDFMEKTQLLARPTKPDTPPVLTKKHHGPLKMHEVLKHTQILLASIIGPDAKELVRNAALKTADRKKFYRQLAVALKEPVQRSEFIAGLRKFDPDSLK